MATIYPDGTVDGLPELINETGMTDEQLAKFIQDNIGELNMDNEIFRDAILSAFEDVANSQIGEFEAFIDDFDPTQPEYFGAMIGSCIIAFFAWRTRASLKIQSFLVFLITILFLYTPDLNEYFLEYLCPAVESAQEGEEVECDAAIGKAWFIPLMISAPICFIGFLSLLNIIIRGSSRMFCQKKASSIKPVSADKTPESKKDD